MSLYSYPFLPTETILSLPFLPPPFLMHERAGLLSLMYMPFLFAFSFLLFCILYFPLHSIHTYPFASQLSRYFSRLYLFFSSSFLASFLVYFQYFAILHK
jgi:hypothetical protein